jgi:hypothetical protein
VDAPPRFKKANPTLVGLGQSSPVVMGLDRHWAAQALSR